ncbi:DUF618-domain-containing protein [Colletotrichum eremochloae]|uniref:CID domain-containing protein n=1 Tax=Colletotrichum sublineola TaxID=1173701 RepID=A0A066XUQ4_COLSU|nr:DUF618-domain-containing protein [Colletotrichum sublineola]KAK2017885.1 DUF618-domain-containing protein [Colletotrichum eremochloae]KDN69501.1 hypothetical protein CSUB01_06696 [Colletotrichum sublineola]
MAYNDDAVLAKLSALNESHDSIATAAQWIMFHKRHAERTVQLWLQRLRDSSSTKRLSLIYLANEVTQQSKARHKEDFLIAFSPVIAEATSLAYKGAPAEIQNKLRRVIDVWKDRFIFEPSVQQAIEARVDELDKARGTAKATFTSPGLGGQSIPAELTPLVALYQDVSKLNLPTKTAISTANQDFDKITDPSTPVPSAPVYAARLNGLLKSLASAEGAVAECVKARKGLIGELEKLLGATQEALANDERQYSELTSRKMETEEKRREVEQAIMRGLPVHEASQSPGNGTSKTPEPERPEVEALTPPPVEAFTPPSVEALTPPPALDEPAVPRHADADRGRSASNSGFQPPAASGIEMLSALASQYQSIPVSANGANKRRRLDGDDFPDLGGDDGIDADVAEMLRKDSNGSA